MLPFITMIAVPPAVVMPPPVSPPPPPVVYAPPAPPSPYRATRPSYRNRPDVIKAKHYPKAELRAGTEGVVQYRVEVSAKGRPTACFILRSSGNAALDATSCARIMEKARFYPARDPAGRSIAGSLIAQVQWRMPR